jgi:hypothetical protein
MHHTDYGILNKFFRETYLAGSLPMKESVPGLTSCVKRRCDILKFIVTKTRITYKQDLSRQTREGVNKSNISFGFEEKNIFILHKKFNETSFCHQINMKAAC